MIALTEVEKTFEQPGGDRVHALRGVSLTMPVGQFITVIGSNGSGKSTILNAIAGTFLPDSGRILIADTDVTRLSEHKRALLIGRVFQDPFKGTCPSMTVSENLRMAELRGARRGLRLGLGRASLERYHAALSSLGMRLEGRLQSQMGTLSGGQRQAVTLLMATIKRPELLLLDEHTAALDPRAAEQVMRVTEEVVRSHSLTTLMVTHSMEQAIRFGDRMIMMHRGEIIADLTGAERRDASEKDLIARFADLQYTAEMKYTMEFSVARPAVAEERFIAPPPA
jgi:putative tryptophan/tyrosine transport system ATP-binding protein